jgi:hypothetical protein
MYLVPARWLARRALERRSREQTASVVRLVMVATRRVIPRATVRAIVGFAVASLLRSRRHLIVLATYLGLAIATCVASILIIEVHGAFLIDSPASWVLALPLVFQYFLVAGLRSAFRIPTDMQANWPFRLSPPTLSDSLNATALAMIAAAVIPIAAISILLTAALWPLRDALLAAGLQVVTGVLLVEAVLLRWTRVPFACEHIPSPDVVKGGWPLFLIALYVYAFQLSDWQEAALHSRATLWSYLIACLVVIVTIRLVRRHQWRGRSLEFDAVYPHAVQRLNLSEAVN